MTNKKWRSQILIDLLSPNLKQTSKKTLYHQVYTPAIQAYKNRKSCFTHIHWQHREFPFIPPTLSVSYDKWSYLNLILQKTSTILNFSTAADLFIASPPDQAAITFAFTANNSHPTSLKSTAQCSNPIGLPRSLNLLRLRDQRRHYPILLHYILQYNRATPFPARCYKVARPEKTISHPPLPDPEYVPIDACTIGKAQIF